MRILIFISLGMLLFLTMNNVYCQNYSTSKPPQHESTYFFTVLKYDRQPKIPKYIYDGIEDLLNTPKTLWSAKDSLIYSYENVHLKKFEKALNNFTRLETDTIKEKHAQILYRVTLQHEKRFERLKEFNWNTITPQESVFYDLNSAFNDLTDAYIKFRNDEFNPETDTIFSVLFNDTLKSFNREEEPHKNELVAIGFAIDSCLRQFTVLHDKKDLVLSKAFTEMARFQKEYFYLSNAHFYYSAALHYNKNNNSIFSEYNQLKEEVNSQKILPLSFKSTFGRVIKNRYKLSDDYIEEIEKKADIPENYIPPEIEQKKDYLPWLDKQIIIMLVIVIALIYVLFFLKTED